MNIELNRRKAVLAVLWIVFYLAVIDLGINILLSYPSDPRNINPTTLQSYIEYGRSIEGKFARMTRPTDPESAPILSRGWIEPLRVSRQERTDSSIKRISISLYGMSHTKLLGEAIGKIDGNYNVHVVTAPGAPLNWSFAAYQADHEGNTAEVVVLGLMTDNLPYLSATSGATSYFDMGYPYTFPRYRMTAGKIEALYPPIMSGEAYREYFYDEAKWQEYREWLRVNDKFYDPLLFRRSLADKSSLLRMLRRAYAELTRRNTISMIYTKEGFNPQSEEVSSLYGIMREFGRLARERGSIPVIYIVNNQGRGDHLYRIMKPVLEQENIPYLTTHVICPPDDPRMFLSMNSHFIPSKDTELAEELIKIITRERNNIAMIKTEDKRISR